MIQKLLLVAICLLAFQSVKAQLFSHEKPKNLENFDQDKWTWGFFLDANTYDFKFNYKREFDQSGKLYSDVQVKQKAGFGLGMVGDMRLNDYMNLRFEPGVMFISRELYFPEAFKEGLNPVREVNSTYVHLPILMKFSTVRINNFKPFVEGGLSGSWNLASNENNAEDNLNGDKFRMKTFTSYWEVGFGIDFYFDYFKFTPSIRGVFALNNELVPDNDPNSPYTGNIKSMKSRAVFINLTFQ